MKEENLLAKEEMKIDFMTESKVEKFIVNKPKYNTSNGLMSMEPQF